MRNVDFGPSILQASSRFNVYSAPVPEAVGRMLTALAMGVLVTGIAVAAIVLIGAGA